LKREEMDGVKLEMKQWADIENGLRVLKGNFASRRLD